MSFSRRHFLRNGSLALLGLGGFPLLGSGVRFHSDREGRQDDAAGFGALVKDPDGILDLPRGFTYSIISRAGDRMDDGFFVPAHPDGMAAFPGPEGSVILVCNHEIFPEFPFSLGAFGHEARLMGRLRRKFIYDSGRSGHKCLGAVTTLIFDPRRRMVVRRFLSLAGTVSNCAGGATPWNTWISCEEDFQRRGRFFSKNHGYAFQVPASFEPKILPPLPLKALGRFVHEAVAVHPETKIVYQTEDQNDSLIYRFVPDRPGDLNTGRLQALAIIGRPGFDTRNYDRLRIRIGESLPVRWVDLENVDPGRDDLRLRGREAGAAIFANGEGMTMLSGSIFFTCTFGGRRRAGQVWRYIPGAAEGTEREADAPGGLELILEPNDRRILDNPDQLGAAPWGDLLICEDGPAAQYLLGLTPGRRLYVLARSVKRDAELSGVCFSPDRSVMFLNAQETGLTMAVTGPWPRTPAR